MLKRNFTFIGALLFNLYAQIFLGIHLVPNPLQLLTNSNIDLVSSKQCVYLNDIILLNVIVQNRTNHENSVVMLWVILRIYSKIPPVAIW